MFADHFRNIVRQRARQ